MIYLPADWLNNPENESEIRSMLEEQQHDIKMKDDSKTIEQRLKDLGELKILEEFRKGVFAN